MDLTEGALANPGTVFNASTSWTNVVVYRMTVSATVSRAGTVTVAAGTFEDCLQINRTNTTEVKGYYTNCLEATLTLAPGVGLIQTVLEGTIIYELLDGVIGGVDIEDLSAGGGISILPRISGITLKPGGQIQFTVGTKSGQTVIIERCSSLSVGGWTPWLTNTPQSDSFVVMDPVAPAQARFYRAR